jgi:DNA-3-methyladenine glycosylase
VDGARILEDRRLLPVDAHPRLLRGVRPLHPGFDPGLVPERVGLSVVDRDGLAGPPAIVGPLLLGARLVRDDTSGRREARIVEVEAYAGPEDLASHARFASNARNRVMTGPPGIAYVYLVYGMYDCVNVVVEPAGRPSAILIRAVEPLLGVDRMRADRLTVERRRRAARTDPGAAAAQARLAATPDHRLASGPGLVGAAFGVDTSWTGIDLCDPGSPLRLERDPADPLDVVPTDAIAVTARLGVAYAGDDWAARPWRFAIAGHRSVSGPAVARRAAAARPSARPPA